MAERISLKVSERKEFGKGPNRRLRAQSKTPGVFYDQNGLNVPVKVDQLALQKAFRTVGRTQLLDLELERDGKTESIPALIWRMKYNPVKPVPQHVDFFGVDMDKELKIVVPFKIVGTSKGQKAGGRLEVYREQCEICCKPGDIPAVIEIDITNMKLSQGIRLNDVVMPEGVQPTSSDNFAVLLIVAKGGAASEEDDEE